MLPAPLVKRLDQLALATLVAAALAAMAAWWLVRGGSSGRLINIERAAPLNYAFRIDVNQAEWPELAQLPEVGEVLARRIVEHRGRNGPFKRRADLLAVRGIGDKTLERFRNYLLPLPGEEMTAGP
ncbi:MAG: helix-hairpin-helix domain-containing protein [Planctomycetota bacterium]